MAWLRQGREAVGRVRLVDRVEAGRVGEGEVDVQSRSPAVAQGLAHEGEQQAHPVGHFAREDLEEEALVGRAKGVAVAQRELELRACRTRS